MKAKQLDHKQLYQQHLGSVPAFFQQDENTQIKALSNADFNYSYDFRMQIPERLICITTELNQLYIGLVKLAEQQSKRTLLSDNYQTLTHLLIKEYIMFIKSLDTTPTHALLLIHERADLFKALFLDNDLIKDEKLLERCKNAHSSLVSIQDLLKERTKRVSHNLNDLIETCNTLKDILTPVMKLRKEMPENCFGHTLCLQLRDTLNEIIRCTNKMSTVEDNLQLLGQKIIATSEPLRQFVCESMTIIDVKCKSLAKQIDTVLEYAKFQPENIKAYAELLQSKHEQICTLILEVMPAATLRVNSIVRTSEGRKTMLVDCAKTLKWPMDANFLHLAQNQLDDVAAKRFALKDAEGSKKACDDLNNNIADLQSRTKMYK